MATPRKRPEDKLKAGRPSEYQRRFCKTATQFMLLGATEASLAEALGVSEQTLNAWKMQYPEFLEAIKEGGERADAEVAESLYKRAKGYKHADEQIFYDGKRAEVVRAPTEKHYPPDAKAAHIWLLNRRRHPEAREAAKALRWADRTEVTGADGAPLQGGDPLEIAKQVAFLLRNAEQAAT